MKKLYSVAILLPTPVEELILQLKAEFAIRFNSYAALKPMGYIAIQEPFKLEEQNLGKLIRGLSEVFAGYTPFNVELQDFGAFPGHTIFTAIKDFSPFQRLRELLFWKLRSEMALPDAIIGSRLITPHLPVAYHDLTPDKFEEAWNEFSQREFSAEFMASSASLLEYHSTWRRLVEFPFQGHSNSGGAQVDLVCA